MCIVQKSTAKINALRQNEVKKRLQNWAKNEENRCKIQNDMSWHFYFNVLCLISFPICLEWSTQLWVKITWFEIKPSCLVFTLTTKNWVSSQLIVMKFVSHEIWQIGWRLLFPFLVCRSNLTFFVFPFRTISSHALLSLQNEQQHFCGSFPA